MHHVETGGIRRTEISASTARMNHCLFLTCLGDSLPRGSSVSTVTQNDNTIKNYADFVLMSSSGPGGSCCILTGNRATRKVYRVLMSNARCEARQDGQRCGLGDKHILSGQSGRIENGRLVGLTESGTTRASKSTTTYSNQMILGHPGPAMPVLDIFGHS